MKRILSTVKTSWETTLAGIVAFLTIVLPQINTMFDDVATTNPDWNVVIGAVAILFGFGASRTGWKSTEQHK